MLVLDRRDGRSLEQQENDLLGIIVTRSRVQFGEIHLSLWDSQLVDIADRSGRKNTDSHLPSVWLPEVEKDPDVQRAVAAYAALRKTTRCVLVLRIAHGKLTHVELDRLPEPSDPDTERMRQELREARQQYRRM